ncbi:YopT-type cysteine protease domain-containing protein [Pseudomonas syringae]|uniref:YopT-type cysteine protease domain-containing protein n=1 Tax=Pseudomonas syringae TaxID=317 RepID=UPI0009437865
MVNEVAVVKNIPNHIGVTSSLAPIQAGSSTAPEELMPDPGHINDTRWRELPDNLNSATLARFDQNKCTINLGISKRAMCSGLSLSWNAMIHEGKDHPTPYASAERMRFLSSFEGVVHARTVHNFYRSEHKFLLKFSSENPGISNAAMAGTSSLLQAAELNGLKLTPSLEDRSMSDLPFLIVCKYSGRYRSVDEDALDLVGDAILSSRKGVMSIYSDDEAHSLGFSVSEDGREAMLFDPNLGEFHIKSKALKQTIESISDANGMPLIGIQVFASRRR